MANSDKAKVVIIKDWSKEKAEFKALEKRRKAEAKIIKQMKALDW